MRQFTIFLLIYCLTDIALSAVGKYTVRPSGKHRYATTGLAIVDRVQREPFGIEWSVRRQIDVQTAIDSNPPGWLFSPLIWLDRRYIHQAETLFE